MRGHLCFCDPEYFQLYINRHGTRLTIGTLLDRAGLAKRESSAAASPKSQPPRSWTPGA